jgi:hypothetical protein
MSEKRCLQQRNNHACSPWLRRKQGGLHTRNVIVLTVHVAWEHCNNEDSGSASVREERVERDGRRNRASMTMSARGA